ncbi:NifB/NifX family molybdenum-iron cluster-binding protein [Sporosalibacterium faouarense]|uniref:NifB/NifX family molybdenum-iron cluster-binding protein n=1 Tax=Sporosalibacterium faouarense TaxID=516123 RepID=UPI00141D09B4|nr:NifB/NifX family molybdenum-iron cluster-binding protein [Sporosalibacterium faouarense]MTI49088.1 dinitrogenase iron-molybdenum cofactor [Bacillota bacterium]
MKIALAVEDNKVSQHFGHCEGFHMVEVNKGNVEKERFIENPGHRPGFLPRFLNEQGVNVIISGGMGEMAQELFTQNNIEVITGAKGPIGDIIKIYLDGELNSSNEVCKEHDHEDSCGHHDK